VLISLPALSVEKTERIEPNWEVPTTETADAELSIVKPVIDKSEPNTALDDAMEKNPPFPIQSPLIEREDPSRAQLNNEKLLPSVT
jgi:hypothetical protein